MFALLSNNYKTGGVFVEFGAYDGVIFSNTYLLEKQFEWTGILIDPILSHYEGMKMYRVCKLINGAVTPVHQDSVLIEKLPAFDLSRTVNKRKSFRKIHDVKAHTLQEIIDDNLSDRKLIICQLM